ncbi:MAG: hypothetical protein MUF59_07790 [Candidatus Krumholzibacteria bacterium]|jgi:Icc-related predicted phosphoesterase|nr:hypothetical protein [Candidatus Krumholzibacteria bacterium]
MPLCYFVSDLHGKPHRFEALFASVEAGRPAALFIGGDILPHHLHTGSGEFIGGYFLGGLAALRERMKDAYPRVFVILGNDDGRLDEKALIKAGKDGLVEYVHGRKASFGRWTIYGYAYIPPTPFRLKDWERYDVSRYVDPGSISPEEGARTIPVPEDEARYSTIKEDLEKLAGPGGLENALFLFHAPPYRTKLDRAALDGRMVDHVPLDVHVGSIAIQRFIEERQPLVTMHGHIHESPRITGSWRDRIGRTHLYSAAHDGPELALVSFDPEDPEAAKRDLI